MNQLPPIDAMMPEVELAFLRTHLPHLLEALKSQQTVIYQLQVRTGGPGSGANVVNLDEITSDIDELDELADSADFGVFHAADAMRTASEALIVASDNSVHGHIAELKSRIDQIEYSATDLQLVAQIADLKSRIEALENGSNT